MLRHLLTTTSLIWTLAALPALAEEASLARLLPSGTIAFLETCNPTPEEAKGLAIYECLNEPAMQAVLERLTAHTNSLTSMRMPIGPAAISTSVDVTRMSAQLTYLDAKQQRTIDLKDRISVAWVGMQEGLNPVDLVVAVEVGGESEDAIGLLRRLLAAVLLVVKDEPGGDIDEEIRRSIETVQHGGQSYIRAGYQGFSVYFASLGKLVVGATSEARMRDMIARYADGGEGSLADDAHFKKLLARTGGRGTATTVLSVRFDRALTALRSRHPQIGMVRAALQGVGLQGLESLDSITWVDGRGLSAQTTLHIENPGRGLGRLFRSGTPARFECLEFAPEEAIYVASGRLSPGDLWSLAVEIGGISVISLGQMFQQTFQLRLKEDLLDLIGPEAALVVSANSGLIPDVGLILESKDPKRLEATLLSMLERVPWPAGMGLLTFGAEGSRAHVAPLGHPRLAEVPIAPTFGVIDGKFVVTLFPISFQRFLAVKKGEHPSIRNNRDFATLRRRVPENAESLSYIDLRGLTAFAYDTLVPVLQAMPNQEQVAGLYGLPDPRLVTRHLYGRVGWSVTDEEGMHWYSHSPIDTTGFALAGIGAAAAVLLRAEMPQRQVAQAVRLAASPADPEVRDRKLKAHLVLEERDRIKRLRARFHLYKSQHGGALPGRLEDLRAAHVEADTFLSAVSGTPFVYLGPQGRGGVLLHGDPGGPDGKISLLGVGLGEVERVSAEELKRRLDSAPAPGGR